MRYSFDQPINRRHTQSYKWDQSEKLFGDANLLPLWVADMDFASPPAVKQALLNRVQHGVYGYTFKSDDATRSIVGWMSRRHGWKIESQQISYSPGIVTSLSIAVECFSQPGDAVIIQTPVYYPFYDVIRLNGREIYENPLRLIDGRYEMDLNHLEQVMKLGAKLLLLCSPHNPGGRIWGHEELRDLSELAIKYGVTVIADEIHSDLIYSGYRHVPFASLSEAIAMQTITLHAPTKTFNLPGIPSSYAIIPNPTMRRIFEQRIKALSLHMTHFFHDDMLCAAYNESEAWLDELIVYLEGNLAMSLEMLSTRVPTIVPMIPESTYLLWMDCRGLGLDVNGLKELMFKKAKVAFSEGSIFGQEGAGFLRLNFACPRGFLQEAFERFLTEAEKSLDSKLIL